jgi:hypothetical protein
MDTYFGHQENQRDDSMQNGSRKQAFSIVSPDEVGQVGF